jgi:hypothetical protein
MPRWLSFSLRDIATLDLRSLAVFRMALGLIVVIDAIRRLGSARALYSDEGVFPGWLLGGMRDYQWSILKLWDAPEIAIAVFIATVIAGCLLAIGVGTRVAAVATWILVSSIQARNPFTLSGADTLIQVMLFWNMFLPSAAWWSVDARRTRTHDIARPVTVTSLGALGIAAQVAAMYLFTAILKSGETWRWDGTALYYATGMIDMIKPFGREVHRLPDLLLEVLTHGSLVFEFALPLLILFPFARGWGRTFAVFATMLFHLGIFSVMDVGLFPFISGASMIPFLSTSFWSWLDANPAHGRLRTGQTGGPSVMGNPFLDALAGVCIVLMVLTNVATVSPLNLPSEVRAVSMMATVDQTWSMFAPNPTRVGRWIVFTGTNQRGELANYVDTLQWDETGTTREVATDPPDNLVGTYFRDKYWRKYYEMLERDGTDQEREQAALYICRTWNAAHTGEDRLERVTLTLVSVRTLPDNEWQSPITRRLGSWSC